MRWALAAITSLTVLSSPGVCLADEPNRVLVGSWKVKFANGVEELCFLKADRTATVWEPQRRTARTIEVRHGRVLVTSDDGRVERWTTVGRRAVVEHWAAVADYPEKTPVLGIAEVVHEGQGENRQDPKQTLEQWRRESQAIMAVKSLVDAMRPGRAQFATEKFRECIDPRYLKEHKLENGRIPVQRIATGAILEKTLVDSHTVFLVVETGEAEKEVWLLQVAEVDGKIYIVPPRSPDRGTKTFTAWTFRWKL